MIAIAVSGAIKLMHGAGSGFSIMARWIIGPPALALFNARKRTGRSLMVLAATALLSVFLMIAFSIIGLPSKAPIVSIAGMDIKMSQTKASELMDEGFDIYERVSDETWNEDDYINIQLPLDIEDTHLTAIYLYRQDTSELNREYFIRSI